MRRPDDTRINSKYLAFLMLHPIIQRRLLSSSTGATVQHVNMRDIRGLGLGALPCLEKQTKDVQRIESVQADASSLASRYQQKQDLLAELKQSLLQKSFSGELTTATQDEIETALA